MLDIGYYTDYLIRLGSTRWGQTLYSVSIGVVGAIILVGFLSNLMTTAAIETLLPVIIGFNTALTGYNVIEKTRDGFMRKRLVSMAAGLAVVLIATVGLNLLFWKLAGTILIGIGKMSLLLFVGMVTSGLGSALAVRYLKLS
jgi:hypothetical protein